MTVGSKEHDEMIKTFDKEYSGFRLEKEDKTLWEKGVIYQNGEVNNMFRAFRFGYAAGRAEYLN